MTKNHIPYNQLKAHNYYVSIVRTGLQETPTYNYCAINSNYVFEYFLEGEGTIKIDKTMYKVKKGDLILWPANQSIISSANPSNPFKYWWINFFGPAVNAMLEQIGFTDTTPILHFDDDRIAELMKNTHTAMEKHNAAGRLSALSHFFNLLSYLMSIRKHHAFTPSPTDVYVEKAIWFIENNFNDNIKIVDIAKHVNISESYLTSIFTNKIGTSPIEYLIDYRIEQAQNMLTAPHLPITLIAQNCGFNSPSYFSLTFKQKTGITPKEYRNLHANTSILNDTRF